MNDAPVISVVTSSQRWNRSCNEQSLASRSDLPRKRWRSSSLTTPARPAAEGTRRGLCPRNTGHTRLARRQRGNLGAQAAQCASRRILDAKCAFARMHSAGWASIFVGIQTSRPCSDSYEATPTEPDFIHNTAIFPSLRAPAERAGNGQLLGRLRRCATRAFLDVGSSNAARYPTPQIEDIEPRLSVTRPAIIASFSTRRSGTHLKHGHLGEWLAHEFSARDCRTRGSPERGRLRTLRV